MVISARLTKLNLRGFVLWLAPLFHVTFVFNLKSMHGLSFVLSPLHVSLVDMVR